MEAFRAKLEENGGIAYDCPWKMLGAYERALQGVEESHRSAMQTPAALSCWPPGPVSFGGKAVPTDWWKPENTQRLIRKLHAMKLPAPKVSFQGMREEEGELSIFHFSFQCP